MLRIGAIRVLRRPGLVVLVWGILFGITVGGALPLSMMLGSILGDRPVAAALARGDADVLWGELLMDHPSLTPGALAGVGGAVLLYWLCSVYLSAGLTNALRRPGSPGRAPRGEVLSDCGRHAGSMLALATSGLVLRLVCLLVCGGLASLVMSKVRGQSLVVTSTALGGVVGVLALLWSLVSVTLHYARVYRLSDTGRGLAWALNRGFVQVARSKRHTAALVLFSLVTSAHLIALDRFLGSRSLGGTGLWILGQGVALIRVFGSLVLLSSAVEVVESYQATDF